MPKITRLRWTLTHAHVTSHVQDLRMFPAVCYSHTAVSPITPNSAAAMTVSKGQDLVGLDGWFWVRFSPRTEAAVTTLAEARVA